MDMRKLLLILSLTSFSAFGQSPMFKLLAKKSSGFISATGGTITTDGDYKVHTFTSSGTFTVTSGSGNVGMLSLLAAVVVVVQLLLFLMAVAVAQVGI